MKQTKYERKMDSAGRILIPSKLREEVGLEPGDSYAFYTHYEDGKLFLCIECDRNKIEEKIEETRRMLGITN